MRKIKKFLRNSKIILKHYKKISKIQNEIKEKLDNVQFKFASFGGADINYYVIKNNNKVGMLRLAIVDHKDTVLPIVRFIKKKRLDKEYTAYVIGSRKELTPRVLFKSDDALVCEYLHGERAFSILRKNKSEVWNILRFAITTYRELHDLGITHLDATLKNFVLEEGRMKVIDFEYYPSKELSMETQKAYDYVRIIEHTLRIVPIKYQKNYGEFIIFLQKTIPNEVKNADFTLVKQWIKNIETFPIYTSLQKEIFENLTFEK